MLTLLLWLYKVIIVIPMSIGTLICTSGSLISIIHVESHITRHTLIYDTNARTHKHADAIVKRRLKQNYMHALNE